MKQKYLKKLRKKGFTLTEIIIVVLIIGVLSYLLLPNILEKKEKAEISATVNNDVKLIASAIQQWKSSDPTAKNGYTNLTTANLVAYLPNTMKYDSAKDVILSSGLDGGIAYKLAPYKISNDGDSFKIFISFSKAAQERKYSDRLKTYAEKTAMDSFYKLSINNQNTVEVPKASDIGQKNKDFDTKGDLTDGLGGVKGIVF